MKIRRAQWGATLLVLFSMHASAATLYVSLTSTNPVPPYASWRTAATNIQDAVDTSTNGDLILVTNGVYQTGGTLTSDGTTNRVAITNALSLESVNGPAVTVIDGGSVMRCIYLVNNTVLSGFTLTNGYAGTGGGIWCASTSDVVISNCVITANSSQGLGGGVYQGTLNNCTLLKNSGCGAYLSILTNCNVTGNIGGGAHLCTLVDCAIVSNSVTGVSGQGGGTYGSTVINSVLSGNSASGYGGGAAGGTLMNCTITGNSAPAVGGTFLCNATNCIIYYNTAIILNNYEQGSALMSYCCTTPLPLPAFGSNNNITNEPLLANTSHLSISSPCRGAGSAVAATGVDIDGEPWADPPSIGCDELYPGNVTGDLGVAIGATYTNIPPGYSNSFQTIITGQVYASKWDFGDGTVVSNEPYISHSWSAVGNYPVVLTAYNDSYPTGQTATTIMHVYQPTVFYVAVSNLTPVAPYDSWAKAATNIQNAIDVANSGNVILVSNGVYKSGSRISSDGGTNRVAVAEPVTVQSVNGSSVTLIDGGSALRCVYLTNGAVLNGFTLTNGSAVNGGGVFCVSTNALVLNCLLVKNTAKYGMGAYSGVLSNCILIDSDLYLGYSFSAGADSSVLNNCTIATNAGVGVINCTLNNCVISSNSVCGAISSTLNNCLVSWNSNGGAQNSTLNDCTIISNTIASGISQCIATDCKIIGNFAGSDEINGAGATGSTLTNCLLFGNYSGSTGGGAGASTLVNCTIVSNTALGGDGVCGCRLQNCIVYYNTNYYNSSGNYISLVSANNCCTTPLPSLGGGNITNAPLFVNLAGGDFHLQSNSPCINSGNNAYVAGATDLDGNPRVVGGTVDIGAYEYQKPTSILSYAWAQQYGLPTDGSVDYADLDGTGFNVHQDWIAGLNPTNALSVLAMLPPAPTNNPSGLAVSWESVSNITYFLQSGTNLGVHPAFSTIQSNILGQAGTTTYTDTNAVGNGPFFYRIGVQQ